VQSLKAWEREFMHLFWSLFEMFSKNNLALYKSELVSRARTIGELIPLFNFKIHLRVSGGNSVEDKIYRYL
jgi:hypothetical protein